MRDKQYLFYKPEVKQLIDSFASFLGVKITIYSIELEEWLVGFHTMESDYCTLLQDELKVRERCLKQDKIVCERCRSIQQRQQVYRCFGGLTEVIIPIILEDDMFCYAIIGQFRTQQSVPQEIRKLWIEKGYPLQTLEEAYQKRPFFTKQSMTNMRQLFSDMLKVLIETKYLEIEKMELTKQVISYVNGHLADRLFIEDVATALGASPAAIVRAVKHDLNISFRQMIISYRVQKFEDIIAKTPSLQVKEVSSMVGYDDPLYFSRLYSKIRHRTPSEYLRQARENGQIKEKNLKLNLHPRTD